MGGGATGGDGGGEAREIPSSRRDEAERYQRRIRAVYLVFLVGFFLTGICRGVVARQVGEEHAHYFRFYAFFFFEHYARTLLVALGGYYTLRRAIALRGRVSRFRVVSLVTFVASMVVFMTIIPSLYGFRGTRFMGLSFLFMPFPWLSSVLQVGLTGETYHSDFSVEFGDAATSVAVWTYLAFQLFVFVPSLVYGRRWFCSMTCVFAGPHAEAHGDALPFRPHDRRRPRSKAVHPKVRGLLRALLALQVASTLLVHGGLLAWLLGGSFFLSVEALVRIELVRFLVLDTYVLNVLWWAVGGRFYCYYCAPGLLLALVGRVAGQQIETSHGECEGCGRCNDACKMSVDVMAAAQAGRPVTALRCVGCGLCVDACRRGCLRYSTSFTRALRRSRGGRPS